MRQNKYEYDAFISHAVEDKIPIANELCAKLERAGLKIWYSGKELGVGDSIEKTIERGLNRSRYGIVIFSPTYLAKNWTIREFYTLLAKEIEEHKVILPVLYNITLDELKNKDMVMADRFAVNADRGIDFVVDRLVREIKKPKMVKKKEAWFSRIWLLLILSLVANVSFLLKGTIFTNTPYADLPTAYEGTGAHLPIHATLLGEMHGLLTKMNACECNQMPPAVTYQARLVGTDSERTPVHNDHFRYVNNAPQKTVRSQGNKVTMAVVVQIETPDKTPVSVDDDVDDLLETIHLNDEDEPFADASRVLSSREPLRRACSHADALAD